MTSVVDKVRVSLKATCEAGPTDAYQRAPMVSISGHVQS